MSPKRKPDQRAKIAQKYEYFTAGLRKIIGPNNKKI